MEQKIQDAIAQIRPFLQRDGGDVEFVELTEDNVVKVRLQGHCADDAERRNRKNHQGKLS